jgi:hypothetical protein
MTTATRIGAPLYFVPEQPDAEPMPSRAIEWGSFHSLVAAVGGAGGVIPGELTALDARFGQLHALAVGDGRHQQRELTRAVLHGQRGDDLGAIWASALSERASTGSEAQADLLGEVRDQVLAQLRDLYRPVAVSNYNALRDQFNRAAAAFTDAADRVHPDANADTVISGQPRLITAWRDAEGHAERLDALLEPLSAAAELARPLDMPAGLGSDRTPLLIALCCDPGGLHRRIVWSAWTDSAPPRPPGPITTAAMAPEPPHRPTRCGRWARLWSAGAVIAAIDDPTGLQLYRGPGAYGSRLAGKHLTRFDPEGVLPDPTAARRRGRLARLLRRPEPETASEPNILDTVIGADDNDGSQP